jgi:hypothetical protein
MATKRPVSAQRIESTELQSALKQAPAGVDVDEASAGPASRERAEIGTDDPFTDVSDAATAEEALLDRRRASAPSDAAGDEDEDQSFDVRAAAQSRQQHIAEGGGAGEGEGGGTDGPGEPDDEEQNERDLERQRQIELQIKAQEEQQRHDAEKEPEPRDTIGNNRGTPKGEYDDVLSPEEQAALRAQVDALRPRTDDGVTDPNEADDAAFGAGAVASGPVVESQVRGQLVDPPDDLHRGGAGRGGTPPAPDDGAIDPTRDADPAGPTDGPEDHPIPDDPEIESTPPTAAGDGDTSDSTSEDASPLLAPDLHRADDFAELPESVLDVD